MSEHEATVRKPPPRARRIVQVVLSVLLVVAIFYYLLHGIDLATVWAEIKALTWLLPIPVGIGTYLWWRRQSLAAPETRAPTPVGVGSGG